LDDLLDFLTFTSVEGKAERFFGLP